MFLGATMDVAHFARERDVTRARQSHPVGKSPGLLNLTQEVALDHSGGERLCCRYTDGFRPGAKMATR